MTKHYPKKNNIVNVKTVFAVLMLLHIICGNIGILSVSGASIQSPAYNGISIIASENLKLEFDEVYPFYGGYARVKKDGAYGFVNTKGEIIIPIEYKEAQDFSEGLVAVRKWVKTASGELNAWGFLDAAGNTVVPFELVDALPFENGIAVVAGEKGWGLVNTNGEIVLPLEYNKIGKFNEGIACVYKYIEIGKSSLAVDYVTMDGELLIKTNDYVPIINPNSANNNGNIELSAFSDGRALVVKEDEKYGFYGYIDATGKEVIEAKYRSALPFNEGLAMVENPKNDNTGYSSNTGFIDMSGNYVIEPRFNYRGYFLPANIYTGSFSGGLANAALQDGAKESIGFIDMEGNFVAVRDQMTTGLFSADEKNIYYDELGVFTEGLAAVKKDGRWGYINALGEVAVPLEYEEISPFYNGLARVKKNFKYGFIDMSGNLAVPTEYDRLADYTGGLILAMSSGFYGFIDKDGAVIVPFDLYTGADSFSEGYAVVTDDDRNGKYGYVNENGELAVPMIYTTAQSFNEGFAWALKRVTVTQDEKETTMFYWEILAIE